MVFKAIIHGGPVATGVCAYEAIGRGACRISAKTSQFLCFIPMFKVARKQHIAIVLLTDSVFIERGTGG